MPSLSDFKSGQAESVHKKYGGRLCNEALGKPVDETVKTSLEAKFDVSYVSEIEPDVADGFARAFGYELVGHGKIKDKNCHRFVGNMACLNHKNHHASLDGSIHEGDVYSHKKFHSCNNFRCPKCYKAASVRSASHIEQRLKKAEKLFGMKAEHGMIQVPYSLFGKPEPAFRKEMTTALRARGIVGACLIFHPFRYRSGKFVNGKWVMAEWFFAPHYHFLGFLKNAYGHCRNCKFYNEWGSKSFRGRTGYSNHGGSACLSCNGFEGLTRRLNKTDDCIVKIFGERKSIFKTAVYQLSHAGLKVNAVRPHIVTWYGNVAPTKMKMVYEVEKAVCPVCKIVLVNALYFGSREDVLNTDDTKLGFKQNLWSPMNEGNGDVWCKGDKTDVGG